jgi:hypothetical protein
LEDILLLKVEGGNVCVYDEIHLKAAEVVLEAVVKMVLEGKIASQAVVLLLLLLLLLPCLLLCSPFSLTLSLKRQARGTSL